MKKTSTNLSFLQKDRAFQSASLASAHFYQYIRKCAAYQHNRIDENSRIGAFEEIWREFMRFTDVCRLEIRGKHFGNFQYVSAYDMPNALMPDGSRIVTIATLPSKKSDNSFLFLWIEAKGVQYVL